MYKIKIGINGFGRIGRMVFRAAQERDDIKITGINDLQNVDYIPYMLKYDSTHGIFKGDVSLKDGALFINGRRIRVTSEKDPAQLKWNEVGAEYVCESTGFFLTTASVQGHLDAGADKVIITGPPKDETPMFVMGVNHTRYTSDKRVISNASCTTNCLAPIVKVLNDNWGIEEGLMVDKDRLSRIDAVIEHQIAQKHIPGATALIIQNCHVIYNKAFGFADVETKTAMQTENIFRIPSQSKAITSLAVMMLWEDGKFLLDDPLSKYIPNFKNPKVLIDYNAKDGSYTTKPASREITIRDLLRHTSGISPAPPQPENFQFGLGGFALETTKNDYLSPVSIGSFGWGGAFNTHGWADSKEGIIALLFTQEYLSPYYSIGEEFQVAVYQAISN